MRENRIIEWKLRSTKVRLFTVPCCSIILFSSEGRKKNVSEFTPNFFLKFNYRTGKFNYRTDPRSIIKFPDSARNRNPEEYKGTVFYRTFVLLAPFYNSGTRCRPSNRRSSHKHGVLPHDFNTFTVHSFGCIWRV